MKQRKMQYQPIESTLNLPSNLYYHQAYTALISAACHLLSKDALSEDVHLITLYETSGGSYDDRSGIVALTVPEVYEPMAVAVNGEAVEWQITDSRPGRAFPWVYAEGDCGWHADDPVVGTLTLGGKELFRVMIDRGQMDDYPEIEYARSYCGYDLPDPYAYVGAVKLATLCADLHCMAREAEKRAAFAIQEAEDQAWLTDPDAPPTHDLQTSLKRLVFSVLGEHLESGDDD